MLVVDEDSTKSKEIDPMVQEQEEQHFPDGIDGPSKSTDAAVSPAIELIIGHFKLQIGKIVSGHSLIKFEVILQEGIA